MLSLSLYCTLLYCTAFSFVLLFWMNSKYLPRLFVPQKNLKKILSALNVTYPWPSMFHRRVGSLPEPMSFCKILCNISVIVKSQQPQPHLHSFRISLLPLTAPQFSPLPISYLLAYLPAYLCLLYESYSSFLYFPLKNGHKNISFLFYSYNTCSPSHRLTNGYLTYRELPLLPPPRPVSVTRCCRFSLLIIIVHNPQFYLPHLRIVHLASSSLLFPFYPRFALLPPLFCIFPFFP